jgi:hypothetical protein
MGRSGTEGGFTDTGSRSRQRLGSLIVTSSVCPDCEHTWNIHPGASIRVNVCAACIYEEDVGIRDQADMCSRVPPDREHVPAGHSLVARYKRRPLRGDRVCVEVHDGSRWALLRPTIVTRDQVELLLAQVDEDLATMPLVPFREKYRPLME